MFTGRKIVLQKPAKEDAYYFQKWFMNKEFRHWYDSYMSVSLDMIEDQICQTKDVTDPSAERVDFVVKNKRTGEPIGIASIKDIDRQNGHAEIALGIGDESFPFGYDSQSFVFLSCHPQNPLINVLSVNKGMFAQLAFCSEAKT